MSTIEGLSLREWLSRSTCGIHASEYQTEALSSLKSWPSDMANCGEASWVWRYWRRLLISFSDDPQSGPNC